MSAQSQLKIYVADLPLNVEKSFLQQFFSEVGNVKDVATKITDKGMYKTCCAIVEFDSAEAAKRAIDELNYTKFDGVPIRISPFIAQSGATQRNPSGNLFIKNLDPEIEVAQLHEAFGNFGEIISCKIAMDINGRSKGFGYVQFKNKEDADAAMRDLKDASINGRPIEIQEYRNRMKSSSEDSFTNIYINNLPDSIDSTDKLRELFAEFGEITSVKLEVDEKTKKSKGFGYCSMNNHEAAVKAVKGLEGRQLDGKVLHACRLKPRHERDQEVDKRSQDWRREQEDKYKGRNLFIKGFDGDCSDEKIRAAFSVFGEIESMKIPRSYGDYNDGIGFICFKTVEEAEKAIKASTVMEIDGNRIYVAKHLSAKEREEQEKRKRAQEEKERQMAAQVERPQGPEQAMNALRYYQQILTQEIASSKEAGLGPKSPLIQKIKALSKDQLEGLANDSELFGKWIEKFNKP